MHKIRHLLTRSFTAIVITLMVGMFPAPVLAADTPPTDTPPATATDTSSVPNNGPTGPDAALYQYDPTSGLWENDYYTYDPATQITTPKTPLEYTYNGTTGMWDTTIWQYDATSNSYIQAPLSVQTPPAGAITHGGPSSPSVAADTTPVSDTAAPSTPDSQPSDTPTATTDNTTDTGMNNTVTGTAQSGDATADSNDDVGTVATGNATDIANVVNLLQTQASLSGSGLATFTKNIQGNVTGDLLIDPASLGQPSTTSQTDLTNAKITNVTNGSITNNINLLANSGNATANNNDDVGSVSTGNANAIADVVNMINSVVAANQSFLGVINIYGDYTGNILMPADSLNALLSSSGPTSTDSNSNIDNADNTGIANNVDLSAVSGAVTARNNDSVGTAASGNALTNLTILNLTGHRVIAANSLLVFVNVMGTWVGLIMNAPAGATSAALGGGVTSNTALADNTNITNTGNYGVTNNIMAAAASGNATATNNDDVGSVLSGNATASANIANIIRSNFSLSNWFGILFINVFGSWHGNFGVVAPAPVVPPITSGASGPEAGSNTPLTDTRLFAFVPTTTAGAGSNSSYHLSPLGSIGDIQSGSGGSDGASGLGGFVKIASAVLRAHHDTDAAAGAKVSQALNAGMNVWSILLLTLGAAGFGVVGIERIRGNLKSKSISRL